jgi:glutamate carboxypeptidase
MKENDFIGLADDIATRAEDLERLLAEIVMVESHASQRDGVVKVARILCDRLERIGFGIEVEPQRPVEPGLEWVATVMSPGVPYRDLGDTYIGRRDGDGPGLLLLLGDLDTAFLPGITETFGYRVDGVRAYGPGIADMKGGLVVLVAALEALHRRGLPCPPIVVVLSGDEQAGSLTSRTAVSREASRATWCFCVECARDGSRLMAARGQVGIGRLTVVGREAYAGDPTDRGLNAVDGLARIVPLVNNLIRPESGVYVAVTLIQGGRRRSIIPAAAQAIVDIRTPSGTAWNQTVDLIERTVAGAGIEGSSFEAYSHRPAVEWTSQTDSLLEKIREVGAVVRVPIEALRSPAAGSSAFAAEMGAITMDGMGPVGGGIMTSNEHIELPTLVERSAVLAGSIYNLV